MGDHKGVKVDSIHCGTVGSESMCNKPLSARQSIEESGAQKARYVASCAFIVGVCQHPRGISLNVVALRSWVTMFALITHSAWPENSNLTPSNCTDTLHSNVNNSSWPCEGASIAEMQNVIRWRAFLRTSS